MTDASTTCSPTCSGFNYCLAAKFIIAIAAIPMIAAVAASLFTTAVWQFTVASYTGALVVLIAQKIDRLPALSPMVFKKKPTE